MFRPKSRRYTTRSRRLWLQPLEIRFTPATFTVNSHLDLNSGSGNIGDLRYCIEQANLNGEADIINIELTAPNTTIVLGSELLITELMNLTITVPSGKPAVTIDGNDLTRIINAATTSLVTIENLTLTKGNAGAADGGAVFVSSTYGNLTVNNCTISNNKTDHTITGAGGGGIALANKGNLILRNSTISGNVANKGAGVYFTPSGNGVSGSAIIEGCTFTLNEQKTSPTGGGGAIYFRGQIQAPGFIISNSTIHNNKADELGGGIRFRQLGNAFPLIIRNCTITGNSTVNTSGDEQGGGMYLTANNPPGVIEITSSIVAGNTNANSPDIYSTTAVVRLNFSALGSNTGTTLDLANSKDNLPFGVDLKLEPLASNGGLTQTRRPGPGSPVREKGSNPSPALLFDQRGLGFDRKLGAAVDIGSVESIDPSPSALLNPLGPIAVAGATPDSVVLTYTDSQSLINYTTIDAGDIEIVHVKSGTKLTVTKGMADAAMNGSPRQGIYTFTPPGGLWDAGDNGEYQVVQVANQVFDTDIPTPAAAAPGVVGTFSVEIPATYVVDITADEDDGNTGSGDLSLREAIKLANASIGSKDNIVFDPSVFATQQKITLTLGQLDVTDNVNIVGPAARVIIDGNAAGRVMKISLPGTSRSATLSNLIIQNGKLTGETGDDETENGAGLFLGNDSVTINNCVIQNNSVAANGGGIFIQGSPSFLHIQDSVIRDNKTTAMLAKVGVGSGGGIALDGGGTLVMARSTVSNNSAVGPGGGIYFYSGGSFDLDNSTISGNKTDSFDGGGGLYFFGTAAKVLSIANCTFSGNSAFNGAGGGIALQTMRVNSKLSVVNSTIAFNEASFGGGISRIGGDSTIPLTLDTTIVAKNVSSTFSGTDIFLDFTASDVPGNNNLIGINNDGGFFLSGMNNLQGDTVAPLDPLLNALANNGGRTLTHSLQLGSPAIDAGISNGFNSDQRGGAALRLFNDPGVPNGPGSDGTDIGAFEGQPVVAPTVTKIEFNSGAAQRSLVTTATISFSEFISFPNGILAAFQLNRIANGSPGLVNLSAVQNGTVVTLTFVGGGAVGIDPGGSLQDGTYELKVIASNVQGGLAVQAMDVSSKTHRLFGDGNGDGIVNATDFNEFRLAYGSTGPSIFDFDGIGGVNASDFNAFRLRYGLSGFLP